MGQPFGRRENVMMRGFMKKFGILSAVACLFLTGCGDAMLALTEDEEKAIVAYASEAVAKGNRYMNQGITYPPKEEEAEEPEEPEEEPVEAEPEENGADDVQQPAGDEQDDAATTQPQEEPATQSTLTDALNIPGVTATYSGYQLSTSYTEGSYFAMTAEQGNTYLILDIRLENTQDQPVECNLLSRGLTLSLYVNGELVADSIVTVLLNDFTTYIDTVEAGASMDTIALFEVPEGVAQSIQTLSVDMEIDGAKYQIALE